MFVLTPEQEKLSATMRKFLREKLSSGYLLRAKNDKFPWDLYKELAGMGLLSLMVSDEGSERWKPDFISIGIVFEEIAYSDFNVANCLLPALTT